jgi:hypothetical protein
MRLAGISPVAKTRLTVVIPAVMLAVLILYSFAAASNPLFSTPAQQYRNSYAIDKRIVFTTYFDWYQSRGADFSQGMSDMTWWPNSTIDQVAQKQYPAGWPGPTNPDDMIVDANSSGGWHDSLIYHPPAETPVYNATGGLAAPLVNGTGANLTSWFDYMNPAWHEWELRGMMQAGINVLMPDDWYNGKDNNWSINALITLKTAWYDLAQNVTSEANAVDGGDRNVSYGYSVLPKIAMFFDTTCMKELWVDNLSAENPSLNTTEAMNNGTGPDLRDPYWMNQFWNCIDDFYSVLDSTCEFIWHGACVVWLYGANYFSNIGTQVLQYCRAQFEAKYHLNLIFIGGSDWLPAGVDGVDPWGSSFGVKLPYPVQYEGIPCGAVSPGIYNLGVVDIEPPYYVARDPASYIAQWQEILDQGAVFIHVETWNELHEGTGICWTQEYGYEWIDLTRKMADKAQAMTTYNPVQAIDWGIFVPAAILLAIMVVAGFAVAMAAKKPLIVVHNGQDRPSQINAKKE